MTLQSSNTRGRDVTSDYVAVIVGAGPAGISTWLHLQKYAPQLASRSIVIEKALFPRDKLCAGGVGAWSAEVLEHLEVELDTPFLIVPDVEFKFGRKIYLLSRINPTFKIVQRIDFDYALVRAAVKRGLDLHEEETLVDVIRTQDRLLLKTNKRTYDVSVLVGADGALSVTRRKTMLPRKSNLAQAIQIHAPADPQKDREFREKRIVIDLTPIKEGLQGYVWHVPCLKEGVPSIAHGVGDFRIYPEKPRADMKDIFRRALRSRGIHLEPTLWSSYPIRWLSDEGIISQPNIILAGDAAGIEPAFGGGIHIALSYGEIAARAIIDAFQKRDFSFDDYKKRLQSHLAGKYIRKCTRLALNMYGGRADPLEEARKFFETGYDRPNLLLLLLSRGLFLPKPNAGWGS